MKKTVLALILCGMTLQAPAYAADYNLSRTLARIEPERFTVYENVIVPWLQEEFNSGRLVYPGGATANRKLLRANLMRYEKIDGQDRYSIHIEYTVTIKDPSGVEGKGLKGQEIVFWVEDDRVMDFAPFNEYWIRGTVSEDDMAESRI